MVVIGVPEFGCNMFKVDATVCGVTQFCLATRAPLKVRPLQDTLSVLFLLCLPVCMFVSLSVSSPHSQQHFYLDPFSQGPSYIPSVEHDVMISASNPSQPAIYHYRGDSLPVWAQCKKHQPRTHASTERSHSSSHVFHTVMCCVLPLILRRGKRKTKS